MTPKTQLPMVRAAATNALAPQPTAPAQTRSPGPITRRPQPRHGLDAAGATLHANTTALPLALIASYKASGLSEKDLSSAFATVAIFSAVSAVMVFGVVEIGWRANFLLEGILFGAIAICALAELFGARRQTLFTFEIAMRDGSNAVFVAADATEADTVKAALDRALRI